MRCFIELPTFNVSKKMSDSTTIRNNPLLAANPPIRPNPIYGGLGPKGNYRLATTGRSYSLADLDDSKKSSSLTKTAVHPSFPDSQHAFFLPSTLRKENSRQTVPSVLNPQNHSLDSQPGRKLVNVPKIDRNSSTGAPPLGELIEQRSRFIQPE